MLQRLSALCRRPATTLAAALAVSAGAAGIPLAQQPIHSAITGNHPPASSPTLSKGAMIPLKGAQQAHVQSQYGKMPLQFEQNQGQAPTPIRFLSMHGAYEVALTPDQLVVNLKSRGAAANNTDGLLSMRLLDANPKPVMSGEQELPGKVNYFLGNKPEKWHTGISTFSQVRLKEVYPGVDLLYYGNNKQLEYDFIVKPGADPAKVGLNFTGARSLRLKANGDLLLHAKAGEMRWKRPEVYQTIDGKRHAVAAHYTLRSKRKGASQVGFEVAQYDRSRPLVIDPALLVRYYDTLANASEEINTTGSNSMVADANGNVYAAATMDTTTATFTQATTVGGSGTSSSPTFSKFPAGANAAAYLLVMKLNATGGIVYSDIIGGSTPDATKAFSDAANGIAIDSAGDAYLVGSVQAPDMPMAGTPYQTFVGFSGNTTNTTVNSQTGAHNHAHKNAYIAKLNPAGNSLLYGSYFGGRLTEEGTCIAVDSAGTTIYIGGLTPTASNFPATGGRVDGATSLNSNGFQTSYGGSFSDGYVACLTDSGGGTAYNVLAYSTFIGGAGPDDVKHVAIDPSNSAIVYAVGSAGTGAEPSTGIFGSNGPNGFQTSPGPDGAGFLVKIDTSASGAASMKYGTYIGGTTNAANVTDANNSDANSVAVVGSGVVYVGGDTQTNNFPVTSNGFQTSRGETTATDDSTGFLVKIDTTLTGSSSKLYGTYLGGGGDTEVLALTYVGTSIYATGTTQSTSANGAFPTSNAIFSTSQGGPNEEDAFVISLTENNATTHAHTVNFSTYFGTSLDDMGTGIDVDSSGNVYLMGDIGVNGSKQPSIFFAKLGLNHPPVANAQSVTVNMNTAKAITLTATDADGDSLTYTVVAGPSHGTLSGTAPNLTYTPTTGYKGSDSFTFKANDGHDDSNVATVSITVVGAPTANAQTVAVAHNTAKAITLTGSDPNTPALNLTFAIATNPTHGTLSGFNAATGAVTYTPTTGYSGSDSFTFTVTNSDSLTSSPATVTLNVAAGAPTANSQTVSVSHNTAKAITLTGADPNVPALTLTFAIATNPTHGTLSGFSAATGAVTYTPSAGHSGSDSFTFTVTNSASLTSSPASVTLNVAATAPVANSQTVNVAHNTPTAVTLTGTDPNVPALSLTYDVVASPTHGTLSGTAPNLTYTPNSGYAGSDSFTFTVTNSAGITSSAATVTLNVAAGVPTANPQTVAVSFNTAKAITLTGADPNIPAQTLTYAVVASPSHGTLSGFNATTGAVTYTPTTGYSGGDSFTFTVTNTSGLTSSAATVTLNVASAPAMAPTANAQSVSTNQDTAVGITLTGSDPNTPALTLTYNVTSNPAHGTLSGTAPNLTYTPNAGYSGADSFQFTVTNSAGLTSPAATVSITVNQTLIDVTGQISITAGPFLYSRATGTYTQALILTNTGSTTITGPISLILSNLANATLANASGTTSALQPAGRPYINAGGSLAAGASVNVTLSFTKTGAAVITYGTQIVAGPGAR